MKYGCYAGRCWVLVLNVKIYQFILYKTNLWIVIYYIDFTMLQIAEKYVGWLHNAEEYDRVHNVVRRSILASRYIAIQKKYEVH